MGKKERNINWKKERSYDSNSKDLINNQEFLNKRRILKSNSDKIWHYFSIMHSNFQPCKTRHIIIIRE